jgi:hypothetical protein
MWGAAENEKQFGKWEIYICTKIKNYKNAE